jgi:pyruvate kinase
MTAGMRERAKNLSSSIAGDDGFVSVNYDGFIDDVSRGDELLIEGGIMSCAVLNKTDTDVEVSGGSWGHQGGKV